MNGANLQRRIGELEKRVPLPSGKGPAWCTCRCPGRLFPIIDNDEADLPAPGPCAKCGRPIVLFTMGEDVSGLVTLD